MKLSSQNLVKLVEYPYLSLITQAEKFIVGSVIRLGYNIQEGEKERMQTYEGLIIAKQNRGLSQTITVRRKVQGIGVEQIFLLNSPKIVFVTQIRQSKVKRAKLFFVRSLSSKSLRLKLKHLS